MGVQDTRRDTPSSSSTRGARRWAIKPRIALTLPRDHAINDPRRRRAGDKRPESTRVSPDFRDAARVLVGEQPSDESSAQVAERAVGAYHTLSRHLARLLGETGVRMMFKRSIVLTTAQFPWLAGVSRSENESELRDRFAQQDPAVIADAFVVILSVFVGLLERLIGEPLVYRLIDEVWPGVFAQPAKDTP
jgi:hypothetical protein